MWLFLNGFDPINGGPKFFIFLTNWAFLVLVVYLLWAAVSDTLSLFLANVCCKEKYSRQENEDEEDDGSVEQVCCLLNMPLGCCGRERDGTKWHHKIQWVLFMVGHTFSLAVTILYWSLLFNPTNPLLTPLNFITHLVNGIVSVIDIGVSGIPVRLLHMVYSVLLAAIYAVFTGIYHVAMGTNVQNQPYIYFIIDYGRNPGTAAGIAIAVVLVFFPIINVLIYVLFLLREGLLWLIKKVYKMIRKQDSQDTDIEMK